MAFIERAACADARGNDVLSKDSSEWYVEAALNYALTKPWIQSEWHSVDTVQVEVALSEDGVQAFDIHQAYNELAGYTAALDGNLLVVDVVSNVVSNMLLLEVRTVVGKGTPKSVNTSFGPNAYFWIGSLEGFETCGCGPNSGGVGTCANWQIQGRLNGAIPPIPVGTYYTNIVTADGLFFYCQGPEGSCGCFSPTMMSETTQEAWDRFGQLQPSGKHKISASVLHMFSLGGDNAIRTLTGQYTYGTKNNSNPTG